MQFMKSLGETAMPGNFDKNISLSDEQLKELSFEEALKLFENTVSALETGGLSLSDSTEQYLRGVKLAKHCNALLAATELKIARIKTEYGHPSSGGPSSLIDAIDDENP